MSYEQILTSFDTYFCKSAVWWDFLRSAGFMIANGLRKLCDTVIDLFGAVYDMLDFTTYSGVAELIDKFKSVFWLILAFSLLGLFLSYILEFEKRPNLLKNIAITLIVITSGTYLLTGVNSLLASAVEYVGASDSSIGLSVMNNNMRDLLYVDRVTGLTDFDVKYTAIDDNLINSIDVAEKVTEDTDEISETAEDVFAYYRTVTSDGIIKYEEFGGKGWFGIFDPAYYYRYYIDFLLIFINYVAIFIAYICASYKVVRLIWEIVTHELLAAFYAVDIGNGQKLIKILESLKNTYIVLLFVAILMKLFNVASAFISDWDTTGFIKAFTLLCVAICVIDGPNVIQQLLGIDAGLQSGFGKLAAAYTLAKGAGGIGRTALFGNPFRGSKGLLNNRAASAIRSKASEGIKNAVHKKPSESGGGALGAAAGDGKGGGLGAAAKGVGKENLGNKQAGAGGTKSSQEAANKKQAGMENNSKMTGGKESVKANASTSSQTESAGAAPVQSDNATLNEQSKLNEQSDPAFDAKTGVVEDPDKKDEKEEKGPEVFDAKNEADASSAEQNETDGKEVLNPAEDSGNTQGQENIQDSSEGSKDTIGSSITEGQESNSEADADHKQQKENRANKESLNPEGIAGISHTKDNTSKTSGQSGENSKKNANGTETSGDKKKGVRGTQKNAQTQGRAVPDREVPNPGKEMLQSVTPEKAATSKNSTKKGKTASTAPTAPTRANGNSTPGSLKNHDGSMNLLGNESPSRTHSGTTSVLPSEKAGNMKGETLAGGISKRNVSSAPVTPNKGSRSYVDKMMLENTEPVNKQIEQQIGIKEKPNLQYKGGNPSIKGSPKKNLN